MEASDERRETLFAKLSESGGRFRVKNALNPILALCGMVGLPCLFIMSWHPAPHIIVPILLCTVVGGTVVAYFFLLFVDRDRLQSEEYLLQNRTLDLIEEKGSRKAIDAATVAAISQTDFLALPDESGEQE